ncbi:outer membrane lipoprotein carrier protein LolA [Alteromonas sp. 14N.309.X.WAT.G.H12]|uniref:LolA family protein n=1 Tax=Alteromonas sp. 14N.309.X.WAT.G.H12 TaxID=3120824 RepID=UPI002FD3EC6A
MTKAWMIRICLCLMSLQVYGQNLSISAVEEKLALSVDLPVEGKFKQEKHLAILKRPFVSTGRYRITHTQLSWETITPVPQTLTMEKQQVYLWDESAGRRAMPQAKPFVSLIQQLLSGDLDALANDFTFADEADKPDCVAMVPKSSAIAAVFKDFQLCGHTHITSITMTDSDSNITVISLMSAP